MKMCTNKVGRVGGYMYIRGWRPVFYRYCTEVLSTKICFIYSVILIYNPTEYINILALRNIYLLHISSSNIQ